jgi:hypothetical protein
LIWNVIEGVNTLAAVLELDDHRDWSALLMVGLTKYFIFYNSERLCIVSEGRQ